MRRGGGVGFIVVLIAAAIVAILAMRSWLSVAPTAKQIMDVNAAGSSDRSKGQPRGRDVPAHGQTEAADQERRGVLPDLSDMKQATDQHADQVKEANDESNK